MIFPMKCAYCFAANDCKAGPPAVAVFGGATLCVQHFIEYAVPQMARKCPIDCTEHVAHCLNCGRGMNPGDAMCCPGGGE